MPFVYYDDTSVSLPTVDEILDEMTGTQKTTVLNGFIRGIPAVFLKNKVGVSTNIIQLLYNAISLIESRSRSLMRGEVVIDDTDPGNPIYNTPPTTALELKNAVASDFEEYFTDTEITSVLTAMVEWSKSDGTGDWAFYSTEVVK